jgi:hypothetical protein
MGVSPSLKIMVLIQFFFYFSNYIFPLYAFFRNLLIKFKIVWDFYLLSFDPSTSPTIFTCIEKNSVDFIKKKKSFLKLFKTCWQIRFRCECDRRHILSIRDGCFRLGNLKKCHALPWNLPSLVRFRPRPGIRTRFRIPLPVRPYVYACVLKWVREFWWCVCVVQVFAYLLLSANTAGTELARTLKDTCTDNKAFCVQSDIAIVLGFAGFLFLGISSLFSGFRVVCFIINGSRFYV